MADQSEPLQQRIREAGEQGRPLRIQSGNSKAFYGRHIEGELLDVSGHTGIITYEPTELVLTARAGTPLREIERVLAEAGQMLPFEPPHFGEGASLGGCVACGLSGPGRPYRGAVRDFVLGVSIINGRGERLHFGGEVMKNVAGYDIARLSCGALGTLGLLLEVSIKVLPRPQNEQSFVRDASPQEALRLMNDWAAQPIPLSACCYTRGQLYFRLSGTAGAVEAAANKLGGETVPDTQWWQALREQQLDFFHTDKPLWRIAVAADTPPLDFTEEQFIDWGGAQRWVVTQREPQAMFELAKKTGGHAQLFRGGDRSKQVFQPLSTPVHELHKRLKAAFDPKGILNPGKLYADL